MRPKRILIFGGTNEARALADRLVEEDCDVVTALAGVTRDPILPRGEVHRGRFGGIEGIAAYAHERQFDAVVDATHPFATKISFNIAEAAKQLGLPCMRLERDAWHAEPGDLWREVADVEAAARAIPRHASVLLTIGHRALEPFLARSDLSGVVRVIERLHLPLPPAWRQLQKRPPYFLEDELQLMDKERITILITKNSGGEATAAKLIAARERKIPVVMVARPHKPALPTFSSVAALVEALKA
ncbi:MAG: cobalt-precorrin-6A reductase [Rhizobiales bacterium]|nr:cobalt-precorrin-6A reductase [Hyphomicrobiales bacterium]